MIRIILVAVTTIVLLVTFCLPTSTDSESFSNAEKHFAYKVYPLLQAKCLACHGADPKEINGGLDLSSRMAIMRGGESGEPSIVPGNPHEGLLMKAIRRTGLEMPPKENDRLTDEQIGVFKDWIAHGAPWPSQEKLIALRTEQLHDTEYHDGVVVPTSGGLSDDWTYRKYQPEDLWAYQAVEKPDIGPTKENPIDAFINRQLALIGLPSAPIAEPLTLIRRVTFDVIGLPPTPNEIREFLREWELDADHAWNQLIERLLASPHYGEQAARHWLDVVRYADSSGFANDWQRPNAWRYRDYVIRSFNEDKPYDRFVREQIAGDEIDAHNSELKIAVGFLRMGPWEHSSMSVSTVSRQLFLDDVTDAIGQVFLAHPLQCARCHDHKFDPIPTQDYYSLQAVFATTQLAEVDADWLVEENLEGMQSDQIAHNRKREWNQSIYDELTQLIRDEEKAWFQAQGLPFESRQQAMEAGAPLDQIPEHRIGLTPNQLGRERIGGKWRRRFDWEQTRYQPVALSVYNGKTKLAKGVTKRTLVPADPLKAGSLEQTAILVGGDVFTKGQKVTPGVLSVVNGGAQFRITEQPNGRRAALADWIVDPANPLTARVMVNRIWQSHFGSGLVGTPNNFGAMGKKPTHPELLDYLTASFIENGWSIKEIRREILMSNAYRRASHHPSASQLEKLDPDSLHYAVFRPRRLTAEELRDSMLAISGELNPTLGGIPARPDMNLEAALQPRLIMGSFAPSYVPNTKPEERNRRTIYALKLRGLRDPFLDVFNQPSPDITCELRDQSNVTTQVLSLLNGQESADRALAAAKQIVDSTGSDEAAIEQLFWLIYGRNPTKNEITSTISHWQEVLSIQADIEYQPTNFPSQVVRRANEENSGQVFEFIEQLFEYEDYIPDVQPYEVDARTRGLADVCLMLFNSNEFVYVY